jgi:hypothetical protein
MSTPSIKGVAFQFVVGAIQRLEAEGKVGRDELEAKLAEEDLEILDGTLIPGLWYPIESFGRMLAFAFEKQGIPRREWARAGFEVAESLLSANAYEGMIQAAEKRGERSGSVLVHLVPLFLNFSSWRFEQEPGDGSVYRVTVTEAEALPDAAIAVAEGILEYLSVRVRGYRVQVSSRRVDRSELVFRAVRAEGG